MNMGVLGYSGSRGSVYYWLDSYIPSLSLAIEPDGEIWHTFFDALKGDRKRDILILKKYGFEIVHLASVDMTKKESSQQYQKYSLKDGLNLS